MIENVKSDTTHVCLYCKNPYNVDDLYCSNCGYLLPHALGDEANRTRVVSGVGSDPGNLQWGTGYFHHRARLFLRLESDPNVVIPIPVHTPAVILGRKGDDETAFVDLSAYGAADLGVSRRHVRIEHARDTLQVVDLDSANGTYLNRDRLIPGTPYTLRNRGVLQLGRMILRIQFA